MLTGHEPASIPLSTGPDTDAQDLEATGALLSDQEPGVHPQSTGTDLETRDSEVSSATQALFNYVERVCSTSCLQKRI